jgi:hypothetical protein
MLRPSRPSGEFLPPASIAPSEVSSDGHDSDLDPDPDSDGFPIHLADGIRAGAVKEAAETARMEAELKTNRLRLAGTLRAVLAERMVSAPTTEFEAVQVPDKDSLRQKRGARKPSGSRDGKREELSLNAVMSARKRLGSAASRYAGKRPGKHK